MKSLLVFFCLCLILPSVSSSHAVALSVDTKAQRTRLNINQNWLYRKGDVNYQPMQAGWGEIKWQQVTLPHTYQLTSINLDDNTDDKSQKTFHRDVSWYQKNIHINAGESQRVFLEFEGAHQKTQLWINDRYVGEHSIGAYTPFHFDITSFIKRGEINSLILKLDNTRDTQIPPDGHTADYVLFGGLYRDVYLTITDKLHFTYNWESKNSGITITTPSVNERDATVTVRSQIYNDSNLESSFELVTHIVDADNIVVTRRRSQHQLSAHQKSVFHHTLGVDKNVKLWSPDSPYLYRVFSQIIGSNGQSIDTQINPLGLRKFELRLGQGLLINGKPIELVGANRHQHYPYIGDAVPNNLHRNDAIKFKQSGMNLVRLAHYPHDDSFIQACDELGLIVVEEPPTWIEIGDGVWMDRLEDATRRMIRNHRNHPSVLGWGAGINHRGTIKRLHYAAKEEDPTRISMNNGTLWTGEQHSGMTDLYAVMDYRGAARQPHDLLFAMEHSGSSDSLTLQHIVSRYKGDPNLIGLASWSGHDSQSFIKRDKQYPNLSQWSASSWDAFRSPKPIYYWYQSELTHKPMVHIPDGRGQFPDKVQVFTNAQEIELEHDGEILGRFRAEHTELTQHLNAPSILVPFKWQNGTLTARAFAQGRLVAEHSRTMAGKAEKLALQIDTTGYDFSADGSSIVMAYASVLDGNDKLVSGDTPEVTFSLTGDAEIVGDASIGANPVIWRHGVAPVMIRVGDTASTIMLTAKAEGLSSASTSIQILAYDPLQKTDAMHHFLDPLDLSVDFGNQQQHPQEGFYIWSQNVGNAKREITADNGQVISVQVESLKGDLAWEHTWGMPGDLSFMIEDGVASKNGESIALTLSNLPQGKYQLETWHHMLSDKRDDISDLQFSWRESAVKGTSPNSYKPTFGQKIKVSEAGGGERGDGGSNQGAKGFALHQFEIQKEHNGITLLVSSSESAKPFRLNGFALRQLISGAEQ